MNLLIFCYKTTKWFYYTIEHRSKIYNWFQTKYDSDINYKYFANRTKDKKKKKTLINRLQFLKDTNLRGT